MHSLRFTILAVLLSIGSNWSLSAAEPPGTVPPAPPTSGQRGKEEVSKEVAHSQMLEKRYAVSAFKVLMEMKVSQQLYQEAVNDAYASGVPSRLLSEFVALRALKNADAKTLELALPALKAEVGKYRPEASIFPDDASEKTAIETMEKVLLEEQKVPGSFAKRAKYAREMEIARSIRAQLSLVDSSIDQEAIMMNLKAGSPVPEARWRSYLKKESKLAMTGLDELGNAFGPQVVDTPPAVPKASYMRLKAVVPDSFWAPFGIPK